MLLALSGSALGLSIVVRARFCLVFCRITLIDVVCDLMVWVCVSTCARAPFVCVVLCSHACMMHAAHTRRCTYTSVYSQSFASSSISSHLISRAPTSEMQAGLLFLCAWRLSVASHCFVEFCLRLTPPRNDAAILS